MKWPVKIIISFFLIFFSGKIGLAETEGARFHPFSHHHREGLTCPQKATHPDQAIQYKVTPPYPEQGLEVLFAELKEDKSLRWILLKNAKIFPLCVRFVFGLVDSDQFTVRVSPQASFYSPDTTERLSFLQVFRI